MKATAIRFYDPQENSETKEKTTPKTVSVTGYISASGKLVFPAKSIAQLSIDPDTSRFKIGTQEGKRKIKSLYLVPATGDETGAFAMAKGAKSYTIPLALILQKGGVDYAGAKFTFTIKPFEYEGGVPAYELQLTNESPKAEYTGKPRGRKPKASEAAA